MIFICLKKIHYTYLLFFCHGKIPQEIQKEISAFLFRPKKKLFFSIRNKNLQNRMLVSYNKSQESLSDYMCVNVCVPELLLPDARLVGPVIMELEPKVDRVLVQVAGALVV